MIQTMHPNIQSDVLDEMEFAPYDDVVDRSLDDIEI